MYGSPALHYAANYDRCGFIPLLLQAHANPTFKNDNLNTALHFAARGGSLEFIKKFVEAVPALHLAPKNKTSQTPLHDAALRGYEEIVRFLLEHESSSKQVEDENKDLPLHYAAWHGHLEVMKLLLDDGNINHRGWLGRTALYAVSSSGHAQLVKFLLDKSADPNILDNYEQSPLFATLLTKHIDIANSLLDHHADPKIANKYGETALHLAAGLGDEQMVRRLLADKCDGLFHSVWGVTPFMRAVLSQKVEVVDTFLEYGFNGTEFSDKSGTTCIHLAAETGSTEMLEKLTADGKQSAVVADCIGRDAMDYAVAAGHTNLIEPLRSLGLGVNGSGSGQKTPLRSAAGSGFLDCVGLLIELEADLDRQEGSEEWSALHVATAYRRPLIAGRLVEAGADPSIRDAFGLSPLDYAIRDPLVWERMGDARLQYTQVDLHTQLPTLKRTIKKCIRAILTESEREGPKSEYERLTHLDALAEALNKIGTESSRESARICRTEQACPSEVAFYSTDWTCEICMRTPLNGTRYYCLQCDSCQLCSSCYLDYLGGDGTPMSAPQSFKTLRRLEDEVKPIRELGKIFNLFGALFLYRSWDSLVVVIEWVDAKLKEYDDWEKTHNKTGRFDSNKRPGQIFLKIIVEIRKWVEGLQNEQEENQVENSLLKFDKELADLYREHKPDQEMKNFICSGHKYQEIRDKSTMKEDDKKYFGADGKLTTEWLLAVLETYTDAKAKANDFSSTEGSQIFDTMLNPALTHDQVSESMETGHMTLLKPVLTDEPKEIVDADDNVKAAGKDNLVSSANGPPTDIEKAASGRVLHPNMDRLENIRQLLRDEISGVIEEAKAAKAAKEAARAKKRSCSQQLKSVENPAGEHQEHRNTVNAEQAKNQKAEVNNRDGNQVERNNGHRQANAMADSNGALDANDEEKNETDEDRLEQFTFARALMERETAWQLAQLILLGSVGESLLEHFFEIEDDPKERKSVEIVQGKEDLENRTEVDPQIELSAQVNDETLNETARQVPQGSNVDPEQTQLDGLQNTQGEREDSDAIQKSEENRPLINQQAEKAQEKEISELKRTIDHTAISHDRYQTYHQASFDSLPPSPLSRKGTGILSKLV